MTTQPDELRPGDRFGSVRVLAEVARSARAIVYRARDDADGSYRAFKLVGNIGLSDGEWLSIEHRLAALAPGAHPSLVTARHRGAVPGGHLFEMAWIPGQDLERKLEDEGRLPATEAVRIARAVCAALKTAHAEGIAHGNVKPSKVMVARRGTVALLDTGLAHAVAEVSLREGDGPGAALLDDLAPEVLDGLPATPASDVWGLGALLHRMLGGRRGPSDVPRAELMRRVHEGVRSSLPGSVPRDLVALVNECLRLDPSLRPASMKAVGERLDALGDLEDARGPRAWGESPFLLGRAEAKKVIRTLLVRTDVRRSLRAVNFYGPPGVGLTALLDFAAVEAHAAGVACLPIRLLPTGGLERALAVALDDGEPSTWGDLDAQLASLEQWVMAHAAERPPLLTIDHSPYLTREDYAAAHRLLTTLAPYAVSIVFATGDPVFNPPAGTHPFHAGPVAQLRVAEMSHKELGRLVTAWFAPRRVNAQLRGQLVEEAKGSPAMLRALVHQGLSTGNIQPRGRTVRGSLPAVPISVWVKHKARSSEHFDILSFEDRDLLRHAAVLGSQFDPTLLACVMKLDALDVVRRLHALARCGTHVVPQGAQFRFLVPEIHERTLARIPNEERVRMHEACAAAMAEHGPHDPWSLDDQVVHWRAAGRELQAKGAALRAMTAPGRTDLARLADEAWSLLGPYEPPDPALVESHPTELLRVAQALRSERSHEAASALLGRLEWSAAKKQDAVLMAMTALERAEHTASYRGPVAIDADAVARAIDLLPPSPATRRGLLLLARHQDGAASLAEARVTLDRLIAEAEQQDDPAMVRAALHLRAIVGYKSLAPAQALRDLECAFPTAAHGSASILPSYGEIDTSRILLALRRPREALAQFDRDVGSTREVMRTSLMARPSVGQVQVLVANGMYEEAARELAELDEIHLQWGVFTRCLDSYELRAHLLWRLQGTPVLRAGDLQSWYFEIETRGRAARRRAAFWVERAFQEAGAAPGNAAQSRDTSLEMVLGSSVPQTPLDVAWVLARAAEVTVVGKLPGAKRLTRLPLPGDLPCPRLTRCALEVLHRQMCIDFDAWTEPQRRAVAHALVRVPVGDYLHSRTAAAASLLEGISQRGGA